MKNEHEHEHEDFLGMRRVDLTGEEVIFRCDLGHTFTAPRCVATRYEERCKNGATFAGQTCRTHAGGWVDDPGAEALQAARAAGTWVSQNKLCGLMGPIRLSDKLGAIRQAYATGLLERRPGPRNALLYRSAKETR